MDESAEYLVNAPDYVKSQSRVKCGTFVNAGNLKLATYEYKPTNDLTPRGVVLCVHGISSHFHFDWLRYATVSPNTIGFDGFQFHEPRYEGSVVQLLNDKGLIVVGMDQQSYGLSQGVGDTKFYFKRFQHLVDDQIAFRKLITERYPNLPLFIMGASMGGCIATRVLEDDPFEYRGAVLLAPMLSLETIKKKAVNKILLPFSSLASAIIPKVRLAQKEKHVEPKMQEAFKADPLNEKDASIRCRVARECLNAVETAREHFSKVSSSLLIFHSVNDTMVDPNGSQDLHDGASTEDKTLQMRKDPYLWHALLEEPGSEELIPLICSWVADRLDNTSTVSDTQIRIN